MSNYCWTEKGKRVDTFKIKNMVGISFSLSNHPDSIEFKDYLFTVKHHFIPFILVIDFQSSFLLALDVWFRNLSAFLCGLKVLLCRQKVVDLLDVTRFFWCFLIQISFGFKVFISSFNVFNIMHIMLMIWSEDTTVISIVPWPQFLRSSERGSVVQMVASLLRSAIAYIMVSHVWDGLSV